MMEKSTKVSLCADCGAEIIISTKGRRRKYCEECKKRRRRKYVNEYHKLSNGNMSASKCRTPYSEAKAMIRYQNAVRGIRENKKKYMKSMKMDAVVASHVNPDGSRTMWRGCQCGCGGRNENYCEVNNGNHQ